ncbi:hypothetical protein MNBD_ALPHA05-2351 [hydrothermal vent metagenome]|uniref:Uncharacterized protein n=1 Tax=hydrothermal vent metagenome TaxID=652676 RepID=A0A3B0SK50_9ZZZZ
MSVLSINIPCTERAPFVASGDTSPVNGGRKPSTKFNVIPPPFTGEVSAKLTEGVLATQPPATPTVN